ncbi:MAG: hypothetical protein A2289_01545 [Deltaproteobacteria bacterium RIFOXYA12_FULL_58_15]|nr:MAG: hypothetical protein A2289_01545 [Deltaproteobacteria bacterium RIFOXYA12_FULL_58_15]
MNRVTIRIFVGLFALVLSTTVVAKTDADFTDNGDGTVTDNETGLMWQQTDNNTTMSWSMALQYCVNLTLASHDDWRLPNIKELGSLVDPLRENPATYSVFTGVNIDWYYSGTPSIVSVPGDNDTFAVHFQKGEISYRDNDYSPHNAYVRCVRGG